MRRLRQLTEAEARLLLSAAELVRTLLPEVTPELPKARAKGPGPVRVEQVSDWMTEAQPKLTTTSPGMSARAEKIWGQKPTREDAELIAGWIMRQGWLQEVTPPGLAAKWDEWLARARKDQERVDQDPEVAAARDAGKWESL